MESGIRVHTTQSRLLRCLPPMPAACSSFAMLRVGQMISTSVHLFLATSSPPPSGPLTYDVRTDVGRGLDQKQTMVLRGCVSETVIQIFVDVIREWPHVLMTKSTGWDEKRSCKTMVMTQRNAELLQDAASVENNAGA